MPKNNSFLFSYYFFNLYILFNIFEYNNAKIIIIPFEEFPNFSNNTSEIINYDNNKFLEENAFPKFVTKLTIGTPGKIIPAIFNIKESTTNIKPNEEYKLISLNKSDSYELYNPNNSISFKNLTSNDERRQFNQYSLINETIQLYIDLNLQNFEQVHNFQIYLRDNLENAFSYIDITNKQNNFIINQLREKKIINSSIITLLYTSDKIGKIIIGDYPHIYDNEHFQKEKLIFFNFETSNGKHYDILTNKIYLSWNDYNGENVEKKEKKINFQNVISFYLNLNLIIASDEYMNSVNEIFFKEYIKNKICNSNIVPYLGRVYLLYTCKKVKDFDLTKFPSLNFNFYESNLIFELNYKDLFMEKNNIYYFLVSCDYHFDENWKIGKPFLKKYNFIFDGTKKLIGYYDNNKNINNDKEISFFSKKNIIIIIIFVILNIILIPICYYLAKRIYIKRKLNAKELNNLYEDLNDKNTSLSIERCFSK